MDRSAEPPISPIEVTFGIFGEVLEIWELDAYGHRITKIPEGRYHVLQTRVDPRTGDTTSTLQGPTEDHRGWTIRPVTILIVNRRIAHGETN